MNHIQTSLAPSRSAGRFTLSTLLVAILAAWGGHDPVWAQASAPLPAEMAASMPSSAEPKVPSSPNVVSQIGTGYLEEKKGAQVSSKKKMLKGKKAHLAEPNPPYEPIQKPTDEGQIPEIEMFAGESRVFPAPGVSRIAVGNGQIMSAAPLDGKEVILFAGSVGTSSLFIWNSKGQYQRLKIHVRPGETSRISREIAAFLTTIPNAKASVIGESVIVEGDNLSDSDLNKITLLAKQYPKIINFTNKVGWEKMVRMDVKVVEFPTSVLREVGLKWGAAGGFATAAVWDPYRRITVGGNAINVPAGGAQAPIVPAGGSNVFLPNTLNVLSGLNMGLNATINLLAQEGRATVLAEPQLSARSGTKATFLAGGELPYTVSNLTGTTVVFKPYGVELEIEPEVDRNGVVRAKIDISSSSIDPSVSVPGGPALSTRKTKTEFNLHAGETFVLSGFLQHTKSTDIDKLPFLGDIPILGALFRSKKYQNKETELVIFVTPTIVDANSPGVADKIEKTKERLTENLGPQPHLSKPLLPHEDASRPDLKAPAPVASAPAPVPVEPVVVTPVPTPASTPVSAPVSEPVTVPAQPLRDKPQPIKKPRTISGLQVKIDGLVLRDKPNMRANALMTLGAGSYVQLGSAGPKVVRGIVWRNVVLGAHNGWVIDSGLTTSSPTPATNTVHTRPDQNGHLISDPPVATEKPGHLTVPEQTTSQRYVVTLVKLALRVTPDVNAPVLLQLAEGDVVTRVAEPPRGYWVAVTTKDGQRGWVASQWLMPAPVQSANPAASAASGNELH